MAANVVLSASAFIPLLHEIQLYGLKYIQYSGMKWYLLELVFYGGGVSLYAGKPTYLLPLLP